MQRKSRAGCPAHAVGRFRERPPIPALRDEFSAVWVHRMPGADPPPIVICPDATIDLQWIDGAFRIAGPDLEPQTELIAAGAVVIGFRFRPASASTWLGIPATEFLGKRIALEDLWGARARDLAATINPQGNVTDLVRSLEAALINGAPKRLADPAMRAAYTLVDTGPPPDTPLIPWLARSLAMSERTLRRRFHESFGYGPKTLDRILRYQRFLRLSKSSQVPTAVVASEAGYADQAHLVRESRRISGFTPAARLRAVAT